jgi:hypothetical protein
MPFWKRIRGWGTRGALIPAVALAALGVVSAGHLASATAAAATYTLDHFKCYDSKGEENGDTVILKDQFGITGRTGVLSPELFCNTARKIHGAGGAGISDFDNHLTWYRLKPEGDFRPRDVAVYNQFVPNGQKMRVVSPEFLAVPTHKVMMDGKVTNHGFPTDLDHFQCYGVKADPIGPESIRLWDQFGPIPPGNPAFWDAFRVRQALFLCNPTAKRHYDQAGNIVGGAGVMHPEAHLVCYKLEPDRRAPHDLLIRNQFGPQQKVHTYETELVCAPSRKREL